MNSVIPQAVIVEALHRNTNSLIHEITSSTAPVSIEKQNAIRALAQQVIVCVQNILEGGWDISGANREQASDLRLYTPVLLRATIIFKRLGDFRNVEFIGTIAKVTKATIALVRLQDPIPTAAVVALPEEPGCCKVQ